MDLSRVVAAAAVLGLVVTGAAHATAITFDSIGDSATFNYAATVDGANLDATVVYELSSWGGASAIFHVTITNNSSGAGSGPQPNRLTAFAIEVVSPGLIGANVPGVGEWDATTFVNFPGFGAVELCNYAGATCGGGASLGVFMGATDQFDLAMTFASNVGSLTPITFSNPSPSLWQDVGVRGAVTQVAGCLATDTVCGSNSIPEPTSGTLCALALLGMGVALRRHEMPARGTASRRPIRAARIAEGSRA